MTWLFIYLALSLLVLAIKFPAITRSTKSRKRAFAVCSLFYIVQAVGLFYLNYKLDLRLFE